MRCTHLFLYNVLKSIDLVNTFLQGEDATIDSALKNIQGSINRLSAKRDSFASEDVCGNSMKLSNLLKLRTDDKIYNSRYISAGTFAV